MNEAVISPPGTIEAPAKKKKAAARWFAISTTQGYLLLTCLIVLGWVTRDTLLITPEEGVGYWLGIIGGSLMLALLLYPLRKRIRFLHRFGATRHWFRMHMIFGLVGPLLILYHCNFNLGSFNSQVALYCMLLVSGSGIVGRYFYARIHKGLYGRKTSLTELQRDLNASVDQSHGLATVMPELTGQLDTLGAEMQGCKVTQSLGIRRSLKWTFTHLVVRLSLVMTARRELRAAAAKSPVIAQNRKRLLRSALKYIKEYTYLAGRVAQFSFYERLFALWHVFHLPIFFMMVISALVHVLAVHMY